MGIAKEISNNDRIAAVTEGHCPDCLTRLSPIPYNEEYPMQPKIFGYCCVCDQAVSMASGDSYIVIIPNTPDRKVDDAREFRIIARAENFDPGGEFD